MSASAGSEDQRSHLRVNGQDGSQVFFRIKRSVQLDKLMTAYCRCKYIDMSSIVFVYDGRLLRPDQTTGELAMEDGDEIDAVMHLTGGGINGTLG